jgi:leucyl/phenylalanyl-tRNA--protein transferase
MRDESLSPELLMQAYASGIFPMAETRDDPDLFWVDPLSRGVIPLERFHVSRSLARRVRQGGFEVRADGDLEAVLEGCAARAETWINATIRDLFLELFEMGHAHTIEVWEDGDLVGGVYGMALGGAFFGESMFSRQTDASKIALLYLVDRLRETGFKLFDVQFLTPHLKSLGAIEIPRESYREALGDALHVAANFGSAPIPAPQLVLQRMTQTS